jgi:hypothetical protein
MIFHIYVSHRKLKIKQDQPQRKQGELRCPGKSKQFLF